MKAKEVIIRVNNFIELCLAIGVLGVAIGIGLILYDLWRKL